MQDIKYCLTSHLTFIASVHCGQKTVMMNRTRGTLLRLFLVFSSLNISQLVHLGIGDEMEFKS